ncbi:MAG: HK97 gp10 family phage protein [Selenomonadaceae bacterium]|nr:HK97 gp10 family phage protein [Selenomonadaceae bacterium]
MARSRSHYGGGGFSHGHITGMSTSKTVAALREIGKHVVQSAKDALKQGADIVVEEAKSRCPVKTGNLRDSIKAEPKSGGAVYAISANAFKTDKHGRQYFYGASVEFDPKINKPFIYPSLDARRNEIYEMVKDSVSDAIKRGS